VTALPPPEPGTAVLAPPDPAAVKLTDGGPLCWWPGDTITWRYPDGAPIGTSPPWQGPPT
jgi:hypothetical protein